MINSEKKCLLVASFGTTHTAEEKACIAATEKQMAESFSGYEIRRAFTSEMVRKILRERNGIQVDNVREALEKLRDDAFREVIIQPLHIIPGEEYHEKILKVVAEFRHDFERITVGNPLLTTVKDYAETIEALKTQLPAYCGNQAVVLMGHGSAHPANAGYACLQLMMMDVLPQVYVGTVEGYPALEHILPKLKATRCKKVILIPFMLVAGDHAHHDLAGDGDDSWKSMLEKAGYQVVVYFHGLGENPAFREIYIRHAKDCMAVGGRVMSVPITNGVFYGVGIGPGDPELLTMKAVRVIREAAVVVVPRVDKESASTALTIAGAYIPEKTPVVRQIFPMAYDAEALREAWQENADQIIGFLQAGKTVVFLTLGDPMLYSTYIYLYRLIVKQGFQVEAVPGITSFCSVAARLGLALGEGNEILSVVPATAGEEDLDKVLEFSDNVVLLKASRDYDRLVDKLDQAGRLDGAVLVSRCGMAEETIRHDLRNTDQAAVDYLSTIIVKQSSAWKGGKRP